MQPSLVGSTAARGGAPAAAPPVWSGSTSTYDSPEWSSPNVPQGAPRRRNTARAELSDRGFRDSGYGRLLTVARLQKGEGP